MSAAELRQANSGILPHINSNPQSVGNQMVEMRKTLRTPIPKYAIRLPTSNYKEREVSKQGKISDETIITAPKGRYTKARHVSAGTRKTDRVRFCGRHPSTRAHAVEIVI